MSDKKKNKDKELKSAAADMSASTKEEAVKEIESAPASAAPSANNEIKETTGSQMEIYDEDDDVELPAKPKKKFKKRYVAIGVAALAVLGIVVGNINSSKNAVVYVETTDVTLGSIENIISVSGTVESAETKTYFSEINAPLDEVNVKVGDKVSAGDVLYTYDADALELSQQTAELAITQAEGNYSSMFSAVGNADRKYAEGMTAQQINDRLDAITAEINALNDKITEKKNRINQTITDIQKTQMDVNQNGISDSSESYFENGNTEYITRNESGSKEEGGSYKEPTEQDRQMSLALSQTLADVQYALSSDSEIKAWNDQITALNEEKSHLSSAKASQINAGSATASKASMESTQLTQGDTIEKIEAAKEGIKSDFNAVVTDVKGVDGAPVTAGTAVVTLANLDDVQVTIQVSKSDLPKIAIGEKVDITINNMPYEGEVSQISGTATKNSNGVAVVGTTIKVTNPDENIILGVEANNKIHAQKADNTIVLPYELVQTDATGDYVYVLENGVVARRDVTIGISNSTEAQITEGLSEGDSVISSDVSTLIEGMAVSKMTEQ